MDIDRKGWTADEVATDPTAAAQVIERLRERLQHQFRWEVDRWSFTERRMAAYFAWMRYRAATAHPEKEVPALFEAGFGMGTSVSNLEPPSVDNGIHPRYPYPKVTTLDPPEDQEDVHAAFRAHWHVGGYCMPNETDPNSPPCFCTPAIAGISDGPNVECPHHGAVVLADEDY